MIFLCPLITIIASISFSISSFVVRPKGRVNFRANSSPVLLSSIYIPRSVNASKVNSGVRNTYLMNLTKSSPVDQTDVDYLHVSTCRSSPPFQPTNQLTNQPTNQPNQPASHRSIDSSIHPSTTFIHCCHPSIRPSGFIFRAPFHRCIHRPIHRILIRRSLHHHRASDSSHQCIHRIPIRDCPFHRQSSAMESGLPSIGDVNQYRYTMERVWCVDRRLQVLSYFHRSGN
jgi:hypothetical protein